MTSYIPGSLAPLSYYGQLNLVGKPALTVSPIGIITGSSSIANNGADYGPDTESTTTSGIQEALDIAQSLGMTVKMLGGTFNITTPITIQNLDQVFQGSGQWTSIIKALDGGSWGSSVDLISFSTNSARGAYLSDFRINGNNQTLRSLLNCGDDNTNANNNAPLFMNLCLNSASGSTYAMDCGGVEQATWINCNSGGAGNGNYYFHHNSGSQIMYSSCALNMILDGIDVRLYNCYVDQCWIVDGNQSGATTTGHNISMFSCWGGTNNANCFTFSGVAPTMLRDYGGTWQVSGAFGTTNPYVSGGSSLLTVCFMGTSFMVTNTGVGTTHPARNGGGLYFDIVYLQDSSSISNFKSGSSPVIGPLHWMDNGGLQG